MADFMTTGVPAPLTEQLQQGMNRVENYQTIQRGTNMRSENITMSDMQGNRRATIGVLSNGEFVIAISAEGIDVFTALGQ